MDSFMPFVDSRIHPVLGNLQYFFTKFPYNKVYYVKHDILL